MDNHTTYHTDNHTTYHMVKNGFWKDPNVVRVGLVPRRLLFRSKDLISKS